MWGLGHRSSSPSLQPFTDDHNDQADDQDNLDDSNLDDRDNDDD